MFEGRNHRLSSLCTARGTFSGERFVGMKKAHFGMEIEWEERVELRV